MSAKPVGIATESFGRRVAKVRAELGWTQARLADRIGISRVAVSHIEGNITVPSERTVALLAGIARCEPHELVAGTDYPAAKAERLPVVVARYTEVEHQLAVLAEVRGVVDGLPADEQARVAGAVRDEWGQRLRELLTRTDDVDERARVRAQLRALACE